MPCPLIKKSPDGIKVSAALEVIYARFDNDTIVKNNVKRAKMLLIKDDIGGKKEEQLMTSNYTCHHPLLDNNCAAVSQS